MHLTLHIGTPKTGTTTLQQWLTANRAALHTQRIWYSAALSEPANRKISVANGDFDASRREFYRFGIGSPADQAAFRDEARSDLAREMATARSAGCRHFVISDEYLFQNTGKPEACERLKDFLGDGYDGVTVLLHLRPQVDVAVSHASNGNMTKQPTDTALFEAIGPGTKFYDYDTLTTAWETAFGTDAIEIVPFKRHPSMADCLAERLGIDMASLSPAGRRNTALGLSGIAFSNALRIPAGGHAVTEYFYRELRRDGPLDDEKLSIGLPLARKVQARFDDLNAALAARFEGLFPSDLEPDWEKYERPANLHRLDAETLLEKPLNAATDRLVTSLARERARTHLLRARIARSEGNEEGFERHLRKAEEHLAIARLGDDDKGRNDRLQASLLALRAEEPRRTFLQRLFGRRR